MTVIREFEIPVGPERVWRELVDQGKAITLMPGVRASGGGRGTARVTIGGHAVTYRGYARQHVEEPGRRVTWTLSGREVRGEGRAHVEVRARIKPGTEEGSSLRLTVLVDGRGRVDEAGEEARERTILGLISRFERSLQDLVRPEPRPLGAEPAPSGERSASIESPQLEIVPPQPWSRPAVPVVAVAAGTAGALLLGAILFLLFRYRRHH